MLSVKQRKRPWLSSHSRWGTQAVTAVSALWGFISVSSVFCLLAPQFSDPEPSAQSQVMDNGGPSPPPSRSLNIGGFFQAWNNEIDSTQPTVPASAEELKTAKEMGRSGGLRWMGFPGGMSWMEGQKERGGLSWERRQMWLSIQCTPRLSDEV